MLCVPASSAAVERFFSAGGITINHLRTRLSSKSVEQLLSLKLNWEDVLYNCRLPKVRAPAGEGAQGTVEEEEGEEGVVEEVEAGAMDGDDSDGALFALSLGVQGLFEEERAIALGDEDDDDDALLQISN
jgi:hypothetical protein